MKIAALIPARLQSKRFPRKLLQDLAGKPVIVRTWEAAVHSGLFDTVAVVTDSEEMKKILKNEGALVFSSTRHHPSGTDRIAEFAHRINADIIVNIQGDEPFLQTGTLREIIETFRRDTRKEIDIVSLMTPIRRRDDFNDPNVVKVVTNRENFAMYFSRAPIPYPREGSMRDAFRHIGVYAFRKAVLEAIARLKPTPLEEIEKLENLRFLQHGYKIKMLTVNDISVGIDTPADLEKARKLWKYE